MGTTRDGRRVLHLPLPFSVFSCRLSLSRLANPSSDHCTSTLSALSSISYPFYFFPSSTYLLVMHCSGGPRGKAGRSLIHTSEPTTPY